jgi:hypothetical protein
MHEKLIGYTMLTQRHPAHPGFVRPTEIPFAGMFRNLT